MVDYPQQNASGEAVSRALNTLLMHVDTLSSFEEKIVAYIQFMESALAAKPPRFKDYWDAKQRCFALFKGFIDPQTRALLWNKYSELTQAAKELKAALDESSTFVVEQVDLVIQSMVADLARLEQVMEQVEAPTLSQEALALLGDQTPYTAWFRECAVLHSLGERALALREELLQTEMRVKVKNRLLDRLNEVGHQIFPRKKWLKQQISTAFLKVVEEVVAHAPACGPSKAPKIRHNIKALQAAVRQLGLDGRSLAHIRTELGKLWDLTIQWEQELLAATDDKHAAPIEDKIRLFATRCQNEAFGVEDAAKQEAEIVALIKAVPLSPAKIRMLRDEVRQARAPIDLRLAQVQAQREKEVEQAQAARRLKIEQFKSRLQAVMDSIEGSDVRELLQMKDELQQTLRTLQVTHAERDLLDQELKVLRDRILAKKAATVGELTPDQKYSLTHLQSVLGEWMQQRVELQKQIQEYKKILASPGLNFEQSFRYNQRVDEDKERLNQVNTTIKELQLQVDQLTS